jgi:hypothetical protein
MGKSGKPSRLRPHNHAFTQVHREQRKGKLPTLTGSVRGCVSLASWEVDLLCCFLARGESRGDPSLWKCLACSYRQWQRHSPIGRRCDQVCNIRVPACRLPLDTGEALRPGPVALREA